MARHHAPRVPLPRAWPRHTAAAVVHALGLAHFVLTHARSWCADSRLARVRLAAERDMALSAAAQTAEEARILRARLAVIAPGRRPHYPPAERLAILTLRAACGWPVAETARRFLITAQTLASSMRRLDEHGRDAASARASVPSA